MKRELTLNLNQQTDRSYRIDIRPGLMERVPALIAQTRRYERVYLITDSNVERLHGRKLLRRLFDVGIEAILLSFLAGEASKNPATVLALQTQLLKAGIRRNSLLVALGGGVVGDLAGFVAATILRGVAYIQIPTTLLAQVDSSVGGKVGIDHRLGKNLIGAFHQPAAVFIDPNVLATLPQKEFRNGLAEVVKIAAALDRKFFEFLEWKAARISKTDQNLLADIIFRAVALKAGVVETDEHESGLRKALNLGHTLGHALEAASGFTLKHGEAVSIGLAAEARIAMRIGCLKEKDYKRLVGLLRLFGLPTTVPPIRNKARFFSALTSDKKSEKDNPRFVLLGGIGRSLIGVNVPFPFIEESLQHGSTQRVWR
jgi:3-dehydroquinate synthase